MQFAVPGVFLLAFVGMVVSAFISLRRVCIRNSNNLRGTPRRLCSALVLLALYSRFLSQLFVRLKFALLVFYFALMMSGSFLGGLIFSLRSFSRIPYGPIVLLTLGCFPFPLAWPAAV